MLWDILLAALTLADIFFVGAIYAGPESIRDVCEEVKERR
jgi:hypothetical protein